MAYENTKEIISLSLDKLKKKIISPEKGVRILLYHSVGGKDKDDFLGLRVSKENFIEQMRYLSKNLYNVISLPFLLQNFHSFHSTFSQKTVVITFDDGYEDNLSTVVPIVKSFNFPITIFVTCKKNRTFSKEEYWNKWRYLSLKKLKNFVSSEVAIGSHSLFHKKLIGSNEEIYYDISTSKDIVEQAIGEKIMMFSYPHGVFSDRVKKILSEAGYLSACSSINGINSFSTDAFELRRSEITSFDSIKKFKKTLSGYYDWLGLFQRWRYFK